MAAHAYLKEFTEDEKYHNLMSWLNYYVNAIDVSWFLDWLRFQHVPGNTIKVMSRRCFWIYVTFTRLEMTAKLKPFLKLPTAILGLGSRLISLNPNGQGLGHKMIWKFAANCAKWSTSQLREKCKLERKWNHSNPFYLQSLLTMLLKKLWLNRKETLIIS